MLPNRELQELARALLNTAEYTEMLRARKKILDNPVLERQMMAFEKEQGRLLSSNVAAGTISEQLKKLNAEYKDFLEHNDVRNFINAADIFQKMIDNCFITLNKALEVK